MIQRIVHIRAPFDKRKEGYGIHGGDLLMVLKGQLGAVQFLLFRNGGLPYITNELVNKYYNQLHHTAVGRKYAKDKIMKYSLNWKRGHEIKKNHCIPKMVE